MTLKLSSLEWDPHPSLYKLIDQNCVLVKHYMNPTMETLDNKKTTMLQNLIATITVQLNSSPTITADKNLTFRMC